MTLFLASHALSARALDPRKQMSQYVHDVWNTNGGLPQDSVNSIVQTSDGYVWIATQEGLARFDGVSFTTFDAYTTRGVLENFIFTLFADRHGTLWVGASGGVLRYDGNGRFTKWGQPEWPGPSAKQIAQDGDGVLWIGMGSDGDSGAKGLIKFDNGIRAVLKTKDGLSSDVVSDIVFDRSGHAWIATSRGIDVMNRGRIERSYSTRDGLADDRVRVLLADRSGAIWAGTEDGLTVLRNGKLSTITTSQGLAHNRISALLEDRDGVIWVGTARGLNRLIDGKVDRESPPPGLFGYQIHALFEDREGSLWIGTRVNGLHRLRSGKFTVIGSAEGLIGESVNGIYEDRASRLWLATDPGAINVFENGRFRSFELGGEGVTEGARSFREDPDGTMWVGTRQKLHFIRDGKVTTLTTNNGLPNGDVRTTLRDRTGVVWIGTGGGLARYQNGSIVTVPTPAGFPRAVRLIHEDRRGRVWFGGGDGLAWWDGAMFHVDPQFSSSHLMSVIEDEDGTLWFGTWSQGLHRYRDGKLTTYTTADGLYDDVAWSILDGGDGNFWMGSNRGIYRVARKELIEYSNGKVPRIRCTVYGTSDGMRRRETNWGSPAAIRSRDGRLWFGTTGGLVVVDPKNIMTNRLPPPVVIERLVADNRDVEQKESFVLPPGTRSIEIHYAGLSLVSADKVRYRYRLDGYDREWVDAGSRRAAYYTNIDPGRYHFRVIAANNDGIWNETGASISFQLQPYFTQTPWFYALLVIALILVGVALNAFRERHRRVRHQALHDPLTGLANRILLHERATDAVERARKEGSSIAILYLDLDGFKQVNDSLGHASGDRLLQSVAERLRSCLRRVDSLARIGGDEFAVLVDMITDRSTAADIADRIVEGIRAPFHVDGSSIQIGISIGIAVHPDDGHDFRTILQSADGAMYRAKVSGGNAFRFHSE